MDVLEGRHSQYHAHVKYVISFCLRHSSTYAATSTFHPRIGMVGIYAHIEHDYDHWF